MNKIAVISPLHIKPQGLHKRLMPFLNGVDVETIAHLSNGGTHLDISQTHEHPASMFTPLSNHFNKAFIPVEFPVLYANDFAVSWLANQLLKMGSAAQLYIEIPNEKARIKAGHITSGFLQSRLPNAKVEHVHGDWITISYYDELVSDIAELKTVYNQLNGRFEEFQQIRTGNFQGTNDPQNRKDAIRSYIYSLFGTLQKSYLVSRILADNHIEPPGRGMDLGAGYGFLAAELAKNGFTMEAQDYNPSHVSVGRWLIKHGELKGKFNISQGKMEDISSQKGNFDFISFFGCLLYADRTLVSKILSSSMKLLRPGGVLIVHENPMEGGVPGSQDYELRFKAEELLGLLQQNAGKPQFYNSFSGQQVSWKTVRNKLIVASVKK